MRRTIPSPPLHMPSWHGKGGIHLYKTWSSHSSVDEESLCLGCNDTRGLGVFNLQLYPHVLHLEHKKPSCVCRTLLQRYCKVPFPILLTLLTTQFNQRYVASGIYLKLGGGHWICNNTVFTKVSLVIIYVKIESVSNVLALQTLDTNSNFTQLITRERYILCCPSSRSGKYLKIVHPPNDSSTYFYDWCMKLTWPALIECVELCFNFVFKKCTVSLHMYGELKIVVLKCKKQCKLWGWWWMTWIWLCRK
jgi:hypothetical protein